MSYTIINETSANPSWQATLNISDIKDAAKWNISARDGIYLGIGYGKKEMKDIDFTMCRFVTTGKPTDAFICFDGYFDANRTAVATPAERNDISNVKTLKADIASGNFSVQF